MPFNADQNPFADELLGIVPDEKILGELLNSQQTLADLAGVFFPFQKSESSELETFETEELPDIDSRYRVLVEQIPAIVFMSFLDRGISEAYISPQIETMLGFTQAEWLEDPIRWFEQLHDEDKFRWSIEAAQLFLTGEPLRSIYRVKDRDGRLIHFHCEAKLVRRSDGRPWFIHGVAFDITELKRKETELHDAIGELGKVEKLQRNIFESAPDSMIIVNRDGEIYRVNSQVEKMFGYAPTEIIGRSIADLMPERFRVAHLKHQEDFIAKPHLREMGGGIQLYALRKSGEEFPVDIILSPVKTDGETLVIAVIRDITRRKQDEEALRISAEQQKAISRRLLEVQEAERRHIALELHDEIGQILTALKIKLEMVGRETSENVSLSEAQNLVDDALGKVRKLSLNLRPAALDHLGLLSACLWLFRNFTQQTGIEIDFNQSGLSGKRFSTEIETSAFRVAQESLTNIARHAKVGHAKIRIWIDENNLHLTIEDNGAGFDFEKVFAEGISTGVAGMRERVLFSGGTFQLETAAGKGTKISADWNFAENSDSNKKEK